MPNPREASFLRLIRGETKGPGAAVARFGLSAASVGYGAAVSLRNRAFDRGWKTIHRAPVPVISIGNLTVGGTGKTPAVELVARWYRKHGQRVAILSRGYGSQGAANDEALVLEENLPDVPHFQDPDRARIAAIAVEECESQILILDDGFQHRRLARDLDIVLVDALDPFGHRRLLPRGLLREPASSLRRAGLVMLTRADLIGETERVIIRVKAELAAGRSLPWVVTRHAPLAFLGGPDGPEPITRLEGKTVLAFCGIGNPEGFRRTLAGLGATLADFRTYPDHHAYKAEDVRSLTAWAREASADLVLTTQKDLVKLRVENLGSVSLRALRIGLEILEGAALLDRALASLLPVPAGLANGAET